jgi:hypothetical protein
MRLTDEELREVFARAEEIERASRAGDEWNAEVAAVVSAAEEAGLSRGAVERALRERGGLPVAPPAPGTLAWAASADGKSYVAEVLSTSNSGARVRFLHGSEHELTLDQIRPCVLIPGERVVCDWPWWGPWTCTVMSYDSARQVVKVNDGSGYTKTFPIAEIWQAPRKTHASKARARVYATLIGVGAAAGAIIGSVVTALVMR